MKQLRKKLSFSLLAILTSLVLGVFSVSSLLAQAQSQPPLFHALGANKTTVVAGDELLYTVVIENKWNQDFTNVLAQAFLPTEADYVAGSGEKEKNGNKVSIIDQWVSTGTNLGTLTPGQKAYVRFKVRVKDNVAIGTQIKAAAEVRADQAPWSAVEYSVPVVSSESLTTLWGGEFLKVANVTAGGNGWQNEIVSGEPGNVIEYQVDIRNDGNSDARNVKIRAVLPGPDQKSTTLHPKVILSADNAPEVSDDVTVNATSATYLLSYPGHSKKFGDTGVYDCTPPANDPQGGCGIPDQFYSSPMNIGTVEPGTSKLIRIIFKSSLVLSASPTPTVTPTPTPTVTPTPSPTPTPTVTPTPTPTVTPSPTPTPGVCNAVCTTSAQCSGGLTCVTVNFMEKRCRLESNPNSETCQNSTPTPSPSPSPSPSPTPNVKFKVCKFEDTNGNGTKDSGEKGLEWNFIYRLNGGSDQSYTTQGEHWYNIFSSHKGCGEWVSVPKDTTVFVQEKTKDGWVATTATEQTATLTEGEKVFTFGNRKTTQSTPTPSPSPSPSPTPTPGPQGGFFIRKYHDENGNGHQDNSEKGLSWKFQWDANGDGNWHDYETFEDKLGEGGVVTLPEGTQVRIKEKAVDGWTATTATEVTIHITKDNNQMMVFGNWRGKPQVLGTSTVTHLPKTGYGTLAGTISSISMYAVGLWLKRKGL